VQPLLARMRRAMGNTVAGVDFQVGDGIDKGEGLPRGWEAKLDQFAGKL